MCVDQGVGRSAAKYADNCMHVMDAMKRTQLRALCVVKRGRKSLADFWRWASVMVLKGIFCSDMRICKAALKLAVASKIHPFNSSRGGYRVCGGRFGRGGGHGHGHYQGRGNRQPLEWTRTKVQGEREYPEINGVKTDDSVISGTIEEKAFDDHQWDTYHSKHRQCTFTSIE